MHTQALVGRQAMEEEVVEQLQERWGEPLSELLETVVSALHDSFRHYTGVYLYRVEGESLVLSNYRGRPTEHTHIAIGAGICGRAARIKQTVTVEDVNSDPEYIACSLETRSEIVVPILRGERVLAEIDIDSDLPHAFAAEDRAFLESLAAMLEKKF